MSHKTAAKRRAKRLARVPHHVRIQRMRYRLSRRALAKKAEEELKASFATFNELTKGVTAS